MASSGIAHSRSIGGILEDLSDHCHSPQLVYPDLDDPITVTSHADAWTLGTAVVIVPANTIALPFDIHFVDVSNISGNDNYQLELYENGCAMKCTFTKSPTADPVRPLPIQTCLVPANSEVTAKLANQAAATSRTVDIKIWYHTY